MNRWDKTREYLANRNKHAPYLKGGQLEPLGYKPPAISLEVGAVLKLVELLDLADKMNPDLREAFIKITAQLEPSLRKAIAEHNKWGRYPHAEKKLLGIITRLTQQVRP